MNSNRVKLVVVIALVCVAGGIWYGWSWLNGAVPLNDPEVLSRMREAAEAQDESAVPTYRAERVVQPPNPRRNVYFGDLHVHTSLSFDAYLFGNRFGPDEAYRFASGNPLSYGTGETAVLSRPLDFVALTDHAESFSLDALCGGPSIAPAAEAVCTSFEVPSRAMFMQLRSQGERRPMKRAGTLCPESADCLALEDSTWRRIRDAADRFDDPGTFTTFIAYEYSPPLPERGKLHRNVIFRGSDVPEHATSAFDAQTALDLWRALERDCTEPCEALTIMHNMNKTWGLAFGDVTIDGDPYTEEDWALRGRSEPLVEVFQIKGASECAVGAGASDEACGFEQIVPLCDAGEDIGCATQASYARGGLKRGLELEADFGFNPLRFGMSASTDTHSSVPGDTEEWDFRGSVANLSGPAQRRLASPPAGATSPISNNPGGLTALWSETNTRDALFDAMQRRESYGTSGTRIRLRFFAGPDIPADVDRASDPIALADARGVPMGAELAAGGAPPVFFISAAQDPFSAPLARVQMVKGWLEGGATHERVVDIACSDGLAPDAAGRCPDNGAMVDLTNCAFSSDRGASELQAVWQDPEFDPSTPAFYYVRVLENPTCRWSTWDALRVGEAPRDDVPALVRERAWSSPIWVGAAPGASMSPAPGVAAH
ncbi:MAG: DUF3604 domain-containing protein [Pseudomonadota bacterium]|nr:DUF3604 domain-containing protein [Pseudomonadota bacterium]